MSRAVSRKNRKRAPNIAQKPGAKAPKIEDPYRQLATLAIYQWGALQKTEELSSLCRFVHRLQADTVLEIGSALGGTFYCWINVAKPNASLLSIDLPHGSYSAPHGDPESTPVRCTEAAKPEQEVCFIRADSHAETSLARASTELGGRSVDFLFIDGDHTYEGVRQDFEMYAPLVRAGGLVAFHDIVTHPATADCHVDQLWQELKVAHKEHWEFIDRSFDAYWGGIGVLRWHG